MAATLRRLQQQGICLPDKVDHAYLVRNHKLLSFEYQVMRARLHHDVVNRNKPHTNLIAQVIDAQAVSELLELVYEEHLNHPGEVARIKKEQALYEDFLVALRYESHKKDKTAEEQQQLFYIEQTIQNNTASLNWVRTFSFRIRRLLLVLGPLTAERGLYRYWIFLADQCTYPAFAYIAWLFFIPRLVINISMLLKHTIPGEWLSESDRKLSWKTRCLAELDKRWFDLGNDLVWCTSALLNCFILIGQLAPFALHTSLILQGFDLLWISIKAYTELTRFKALDEEYKALYNNPKISKDDKQDIGHYRYHLNLQMKHEQKKLLLSFTNNTMILLSVILSVPALATSPLVPTIGAVLSVLMTCGAFWGTSYLDRHKPDSNLDGLKKHSFFKSHAEQNKTDEETSIELAPLCS
jgi:hypothetical protein